MEKTKILILGIGQSNFLDQLYGDILQYNKNFNFSIDGYVNIPKGKVKSHSNLYKDFYDFKNKPIRKKHLWINFFQFAKRPFFWQIIFFEISQKRSISEIKKILLEWANARYRTKSLIEPLKPDLIHFHFCIPANLKELYFLNPKIKTICSFWGSDLLRLTGVSNVFYVRKTLQNSSAITVQTPELAEILLCKYGRQFQKKLTSLRFTLKTDIFKEIDCFRTDLGSVNDFKSRHLIPLDKFTVALGHNAFPENNHVRMIEQIKLLPPSILEDTVFVLHLSYGGNNIYIKNLIELSKKEWNLNLIIITEYFDEQEIALLRIATDALIHMPVSDALSAAMTEVLYAGNRVISAAWLPYGLLRRNNIKFDEVESFKEIPEKLASIINNKKYTENKNPQNIKKLLFPNITTPQWIELIDNVIDKKNKS
jgi:hypothetical protein